MAIQITDLEKFTLTVAEQNAAGGVVPIVGVPVWAGSNDAVATVLAAPDGLSAVVTSVALGSMSVACAVDGLTVTMDVNVVASPGVLLVLTAQAPEPK